MRRVAAACFIALGVINLGGCPGAVTRPVLAVILSVSGSAEWAADAAAPVWPIEDAAAPGAGSVVRTRSGELQIGLVPGALIYLSAETELQIKELTVTKDGNDTEDRLRNRVARIRLNRGSVAVLLDSPARFTVETSQVTIKVPPGGLIRLTTTPGVTRLTCVRGKIYLEGQTSLASIDAGNTQTWPSGQTPRPAADDGNAQTDVTEALRAETQLRQATARHGSVSPLDR